MPQREREMSDGELQMYYVENGGGGGRSGGLGRVRPTSSVNPIPAPSASRSKVFTTPAKVRRPDDDLDPAQWVEKLAKPLGEGSKAAGKQMKGLSIDDVVASWTWPVQGKIKLGSPRSIEACLQHGVDPSMLVPRGRETFLAEDFESAELMELQYQHHESMRRDLFAKVSRTRDSLPPDGKWAQSKLRRENSSDALPTAVRVDSSTVDMEKQRLAKRKEKQAQELSQIESYENRRAEIQAELDAKLRRVAEKEEQRKATMRRREDARQKRVFEASLKKAENEKRALERERRVAQEVWMEEKREREEAAAREAELQRLRQEEAAERAARELEWRMHNQAILDQQAAALDRRRHQMELDEEERQKSIAEMKKQRKLELEERNRRVDQKMQKTKQEGQNIMAARRAEYEGRDQAAARRRAEQEQERLKKEKAARKAEARKEAQRQRIKEQAEEKERRKIEMWRQRAEEEEERKAEIARERELLLKRRHLEKTMQAEEKELRVQCMRRKQAFENKKLLEKIQEDTQKANIVRDFKEDLRKQRRQANLEGAMMRQLMLEELDRKQLEISRKNAALARPTTAGSRGRGTPGKERSMGETL